MCAYALHTLTTCGLKSDAAVGPAGGDFIWVYKSLQATDANVHFIYHLIKHFPGEFMVSISGFTSYYSQYFL